MDAFDPTSAARWLAEAIGTGNPLRDLPEDLAPPDQAAGEDIALATLDALGIVACGVRLLRLPDGTLLAGPMLEGRLLANGAPVALGALRHPSLTAAAIGVLAEDLPADGHGPPRFTALHAALDIAATRFTDTPTSLALRAADLGGLGLVVAGRPKRGEPGLIRVLIGAAGTRRQGHPVDLLDAFAAAALAARRLGGLPAGALLVVAGLSAALPARGRITSDFGPLGKVEVTFG